MAFLSCDRFLFCFLSKQISWSNMQPITLRTHITFSLILFYMRQKEKSQKAQKKIIKIFKLIILNPDYPDKFKIFLPFFQLKILCNHKKSYLCNSFICMTVKLNYISIFTKCIQLLEKKSIETSKLSFNMHNTKIIFMQCLSSNNTINKFNMQIKLQFKTRITISHLYIWWKTNS